MKTIRDLLERDLSERIEEVIQLDQTDERSVYTELTEYVATSRIREQYRELLRAFAEMPKDPHEGVGVWISGFFGSGKSSFAKNLGYVLSNPTVLGVRAAELFKRQLGDPSLGELIDYINTALPTEVVMFDVQKDRAVRAETGEQRMAEIIYTVLLRHLGYAEDFDVADLEIELEREGRLEEFASRCQDKYGQPWRLVRKGAQKISRASALLHDLDPATYPDPETWARSLAGRSADMTITRLVDRTFDLMARKCPGKGLVFVIDEVGQYVGRSPDKIDDLRAVVEEFGKQSKNRLRRREAAGPVWIVVTSQEKLDEVVAALDSKRVELARLQDRFARRVDLSPADIREVATRRVLAKKQEAVAVLSEFFRKAQGQLNAAWRLERTHRRATVAEDEFIQFYPYPPHFVDLSIDIMGGVRRQPEAPRHLGGSNRTIIKQAFEILVSDRTRLADKTIGTLVTLDRIFELVEGNLPSERQKDIADIQDRLGEWPTRVAKALALLEFVRDVPRTEANVAAVLVDEVGQSSPVAEVRQAIAELEAAQFVRHADDGWKLQTAQEKHWDTERRSYLDPRPSARNELKREALKDIFLDDPRVQRYRYRDMATFRLGITVDGARVGDAGRLLLALVTADDASVLQVRVEETREESRQAANRSVLYWVFPLNAEVDDLIANLYASRQMKAKYEQLRAQNRTTRVEEALVVDEEHEARRYQARLREKLASAVASGVGVFRGVTRDGSELGRDVSEIAHRFLNTAVPQLYPKLEIGARPVRGTEAEEILRAAGLQGLSAVFYEGDQGFGLVKREADQFFLDVEAPVAREVLDYLRYQQDYGNRVTGANLESHFGEPEYGWEVDVLRLVLATLLRAAAIEVTSRDQRIRSYQDPQARAVFASLPAFRAASFAPREKPALKVLTTAAEHWETLTGREVDVEEHAIGSVVREFASKERAEVLPLFTQVDLHRLPFASEVRDYLDALGVLTGSDDEECVRTLGGEGKSLKQARERVARIRAEVEAGVIDTIKQARLATGGMWPLMTRRGIGDDELAAEVAGLAAVLETPAVLDELDKVRAATRKIEQAYHEAYDALHARRAEAFAEAIERVKAVPAWLSLTAELQASVLEPLTRRACAVGEMATGALACAACRAPLDQMESDLAARSGLLAAALARIEELVRPGERVERIRVASFFGGALDTEEAVNEAIERLREHLLKKLAEGVKLMVE
ncbi:MAG: BREX system P-loop protein BrxC [Bacillota bacterium]|nr:MAG: BREX system P-loop protein BrxC [Bacillota bacterium]